MSKKSYCDTGKEREEVGDGEVAKVSLQLLSRVMYYQFECQNFLTQESLYPPPRKKREKRKIYNNVCQINYFWSKQSIART